MELEIHVVNRAISATGLKANRCTTLNEKPCGIRDKRGQITGGVKRPNQAVQPRPSFASNNPLASSTVFTDAPEG
jgi:hypothetical protein